MKGIIYFLAIVFSVFLSSCEKKTLPITEESPAISFQVEFVKENEGYKSEVKSFTNRRVNSTLIENINGSVQIAREVLYDIVLENGQELEFGFWFMKFTEEKDLLVIGEGTWDYLDGNEEMTNFYQNYDEARILIDYNVVFYNNSNDDFRVKEINTELEDGIEKSFARIEFQGSARGFYDPLATINEYIITNGTLADILE